MRYTFDDNGTERTVTIPDEWLQRNKKAYSLSTKEAILMYLSDEGYISNDVVEELTEKAKGMRGGTGERKPRKAPKRKEDPIKRALIEGLYQYLLSGAVDDKLMFGRTISPIEITNPERIIAFSIGNDKYELTLSKKRQPK